MNVSYKGNRAGPFGPNSRNQTGPVLQQIGTFLIGVSLFGYVFLGNNAAHETQLANDERAMASRLAAVSVQKGDANDYFSTAATRAYRDVYGGVNNDVRLLPIERRKFDVGTWDQKGDGGLTDLDRTILGELYGNADAVFEFGLGESTFIANHIGVRRYAGTDSDPSWIGMARDKVSKHFRFYLADMGNTKEWGFPRDVLTKSSYQFQFSALLAEPESFDVYMVDGRFRAPTVLASFLHASQHAKTPEQARPVVLLHDCSDYLIAKQPRRRAMYKAIFPLFELERHDESKLCIFRRNGSTTDEQILHKWQELTDIYMRTQFNLKGIVDDEIDKYGSYLA